MEGDVRGPEVGVAVGVRRRPGRAVGERGPGVAPRGAVGRRLESYIGPRVGHDVGAARALDDGGVVDGGAARDGARVGIRRVHAREDGHDGHHAAEELLPHGCHLKKRSEVALGSLYGKSCVWPASLLGENCGRSEWIQEAKRKIGPGPDGERKQRSTGCGFDAMSYIS